MCGCYDIFGIDKNPLPAKYDSFDVKEVDPKAVTSSTSNGDGASVTDKVNSESAKTSSSNTSNGANK